MSLLGLEVVLATVVPLFFGSMGVVHELRGRRDFQGSLLVTTVAWIGISLGMAIVAVFLVMLGA